MTMPARTTVSASANDRAKLASPVRERLQSWGLSPLTGALLLAWASSMVLLPIFLWTVGPAALPWSASMTVILQLLCVLAVLRQSWQPLDLTRATLIVFAGAWLIEWAGSKTGFIFGTYDYTNLFRPQLAGVPSIVPLAWLMMLPPAWAVSQALTRRTAGVAFLLASAVAFTAWDLFLDPQMVAWGAWVWPDGGGYFDIPWHNFAGWIAGALLLTALVRPRAVPVRPLLVVYSLTWALQSIGLGFFWQLPGPALCGFLVMGALMIAAWLSLHRTSRAAGDVAPDRT